MRNSANATSVTRSVVLVVEDDPDAREIYDGMLCYAGYDVVTTGTIAEGRRAALLRRPDVVVLDCHLPDGTGIELIRAWRATDAMRAVPIVMVTAFSEDHIIDAAARAGANAFLVKPCSIDTLTTHLMHVLGDPMREAPRTNRDDVPPIGGPSPTSGPSPITVRRSVFNRPAPRRNIRCTLALLPSLGQDRPLGEDRHFAGLHEHEGTLQARCWQCLRGSPILGERAREAERRAVSLGWCARKDGWTCPVCIERTKTHRRS